jgi:hypothetical protein
MAGLNVRVIGADHAHSNPQHMSADTCCEHEKQPDRPHDNGHHDGDCHHHHCSMQAQPMTLESDHFIRFVTPDSQRLVIRHEGEFPPEEPFLSSEKPPLI